MPRDEGKEPGVRPPNPDSQLPPIEDKDRPGEPGSKPRGKPRAQSEFEQLLNRTLLQTILLKYPGARSRVRSRRRNRTRGRQRVPTTAQEAWQRQARAPARPTRDTGVARTRWGGSRGFGGRNPILTGVAWGEWNKWFGRSLDREIARDNILKRRGGVPSDPGPRGRRRNRPQQQPQPQAGPDTKTDRRGSPPSSNRPSRYSLPGGIRAPLPEAVKPQEIKLPDLEVDDVVRIPGISGAPVALPATLPAPRPVVGQVPRSTGVRFSFASPVPELGRSTRTAPRPLRQAVRTRESARAQAQGLPLTGLNSLGVPSVPTNGREKCECPPKRKRKPGCTNPLISKSISGNVLTIKRELKCPPSRSK